MAQIISAQQLFALPPASPTTHIVEGLLRTRRKRPSILCGFPGAGKSTLAHQLAVSVANGIPFLGRKTMPGHVLFWKNEEGAEDVREDLEAAGLTASTKVAFILPTPGDNNFAEMTEALKQFPDTKLVIIETLQDFLRVEDISDNNVTREAMQRFMDEVMAPHADAAYLFLHHFGKGKLDAELSMTKVLGATAIVGAVDTKIFLQQVSDADPRRIIHAQVRKGIPFEPTYLEFDPHSLMATLGATVSSEQYAAKQGAKKDKELALHEAILTAANANGGLPKWELVKLVGGNSQNVGKAIDNLIKDNWLTVQSGGEKGTAHLLYATGNEPFQMKYEGGAPVSVIASAGAE